MEVAVRQFPTQSQPLTNIAPVKRGMSWVSWALLRVMRSISKLEMARELEFIHFARWQRVRWRDLPRLGPAQPREHFKNDFFLFATNYNGDWDQYIDSFARVPRIERGMWWLWRFSRGYPGPLPIRTFKEWIRYHTYPERFYYSAYPRSTVRNIAAALAVKHELERFAEESYPTETTAEFKARNLRMVRQLAPCLGSAPGVRPTTAPRASSEEPPRPAGAAAAGGTPAPARAPLLGPRWSTAPLVGPILGRLAGQHHTPQSYVTAISPIEVKPAHAVTDAIIDFIDELNRGRGFESFAQCPMLHMARILIIDDLRPALGVAGAGSLKTNYLLFIADVDGSVDDFLDALYTADPELVDRLWGSCLGYPGDCGGPVFFRRYIERCSLRTHLPFAAFPRETAREIRGALVLHANLLEWIAWVPTQKKMTDEELKSQWEDWLNSFVLGGAAHR
jgi:hypothetical protein